MLEPLVQIKFMEKNKYRRETERDTGVKEVERSQERYLQAHFVGTFSTNTIHGKRNTDDKLKEIQM